jgi:hypothetical protein
VCAPGLAGAPPRFSIGYQGFYLVLPFADGKPSAGFGLLIELPGILDVIHFHRHGRQMKHFAQ